MDSVDPYEFFWIPKNSFVLLHTMFWTLLVSYVIFSFIPLLIFLQFFYMCIIFVNVIHIVNIVVINVVIDIILVAAILLFLLF